MGKRGPGAGRLKAAAAGAPAAPISWGNTLFEDFQPPAPVIAAHPWEQDGMPQVEQVLAFLRDLPIVSGLRAGEKLELIAFQERFVRETYGPLRPDGNRMVRLAGLSVGRGNGKSALLAGLSLAHLLGPMREPYGECYAAALDREQAGVLYNMTRAYIEAVPWMAARVSARALIREADLRRWARIAREEGVAIHGHVDPAGGVTIRLSAAPASAIETAADDFDKRIDEYGAM